MRGSTFWGIVLVVLGVIFLLNSLGLLAVNAWNLIWPIFLILLGLWVLWGALFGRGQITQEHASIPLEGASRASVRLNHGAGRLTIGSGADGDHLLDGTFGGGVEYRANKDGDSLNVRLRMRSGGGGWGPWNWAPGALNWDLRLNGGIPLALDCETGASENQLDLSGLRVTDLQVRTGASSTDIRLPSSAGSTRVQIRAGAASVNVQVPTDVGARIRVRGGLAGKEIDTNRFPRSGDFYESVDYATAANKADIDVDMGAGSIQVR